MGSLCRGELYLHTNFLKKLILIICVSSFPFMFSLQGDFVFDDSEAIVKNRDVISESWIEPFYNDFWGTSIKSNLSHKSYRPFTIISYKLNFLISGRKLSALSFKITNLICHIICCILVWLTYENILIDVKINVQKIFKKVGMDIALTSTLLFAVHPIHVEAISGAVGRADILAGITFFSAFLMFSMALKKKKYILFAATVALAAISMFFKENGVTVLGFCVFYEWILNFKRKIPYHISTGMVKRTVFLLLSIISLLYWRWTIMGGAKPEFQPTDNPAAFTNKMFTKIATYSYVHFLNIMLLVWPHWLCYDWSMGCVPLIEQWFDLRILLALTMYIYILFLLITVVNGKNSDEYRRLILLACLLIMIPFLPAANIFYPVGFVIAERVLYIPSVGYCLLTVLGLNKLMLRLETKTLKRTVIASLISILLIFSLKSWQRSYDWQNEYNLFLSGLRVCPLNAKVRYNVAKVADAKQNIDWAIIEYKEAIRLYPAYYQAMNNLANLLKAQKRYTEAEYYLRSSLKYKSDFSAAWMNLGIVLSGLRRYDESLSAYNRALQHRHKYPDCYYNIGNLFLEMNKTEDAVNNWEQAIKLNPKHVLAWTNLLALLDNTGQLNKAAVIVSKALAELPDSASINFAAGNIYGKMEEYATSEKYFKNAIQLFGQKVKAIHYANLGVLYHRWKRHSLAKEAYEKSLRIDPMFISAKKNLESLVKIKHS